MLNPRHRAVATTTPECRSASASLRCVMLPVVRITETRPPVHELSWPPVRLLSLRPSDSPDCRFSVAASVATGGVSDRSRLTGRDSVSGHLRLNPWEAPARLPPPARSASPGTAPSAAASWRARSRCLPSARAPCGSDGQQRFDDEANGGEPRANQRGAAETGASGEPHQMKGIGLPGGSG